MEFNRFMELEYPFDWSFAIDSLSDITEIASAEGALVPFSENIGQVDSEVTEYCPFGIPLPVDHFFVPCVTDESSLTDAISTSIFPSDCYSAHDQNSQIFEASPHSRALIAPDAMHTGKSAKREPFFLTDERSLTDAISSSTFPSDCYSVHDQNIQIHEASPFSRELIAPDAMHTGKSAKSEPFFLTDERSLTDAISTSIFPSDCYSVHDQNIQILEALPLSQALIAPDAMHTGKYAKSKPFFTQGICLSETNINFEEKVMNQAEESVITERREMGRARLAHIGYDDIKRYFYMPITQAAKEMNVGLTILKKRCRELRIPRWPHRKMKSLRSLIHNVQELGKSPTVQDMNELEMLGRLMEENPEIQLTEKTKKLRQACFKASYKKRRGQLTCQKLSF